MTYVIQLNEMIPVITSLGNGFAILVEKNQHEQYWTVAMENGAIVTFPQSKIRICKSYTHNRGISDEEMKEIIK